MSKNILGSPTEEYWNRKIVRSLQTPAPLRGMEKTDFPPWGYGEGVGERVAGVTELHSDSPLLYCLHHIPKHSTHFASKVELTLFVFYTLSC